MCCGSGNKACGICGNADGNCLASLCDDFFFEATKEQVEKRLAEGRYVCDKELMEKYVKTAKDRPNAEVSVCCENRIYKGDGKHV